MSTSTTRQTRTVKIETGMMVTVFTEVGTYFGCVVNPLTDNGGVELMMGGQTFTTPKALAFREGSVY